MSNSSLVTTGPTRYFVGSSIQFQLDAELNQLPWDLTGGSGSLKMTAPDASTVTISATIQGRGAVAAWTVSNIPGVWVRAWDVTDSTGVRQVSEPITFEVVVSPGTPF